MISQTSRQYEVSLADSFKSGGVVVKPDGSELSSVTAYLKNFYKMCIRDSSGSSR